MLISNLLFYIKGFSMLYSILFRYNSWPFHYRLIMFLTYSIAVIFALTIHEFAHAFIAHKLGDNTAKIQGRMSLNPKVHFDIVGIICFLFLGFGWAKPVPINPYNFKNIKRDIFFVSIAGIVANLILVIIFCPISLLLGTLESSVVVFIFYCLFTYLYQTNLVFMVFNLLPIKPLDGYNAIESQLSYTNPFVKFMQSYGTYVMLGVVLLFSVTNVFSYLVQYVGYPIEMLWRLILGIKA